jgi:hypothetical protein
METFSSLLKFASDKPLAFSSILLIILGFIFLFLKTFRVSFKKGPIPNIESRSSLESNKQLVEAHAKIKELEDKLLHSHVPDFIKKTDNGEYIGFMIAPKPYITVWVDGNWNSEEHFQIFDRFERLWDDEQDIYLVGKSPNLPSDLYHIIEKKAKTLPKLSIHCSHQLGEFFTRYFSDFKNVEVLMR